MIFHAKSSATFGLTVVGFSLLQSKCQRIQKGSGIIIRWDKDAFFFFWQKDNENYLSSEVLIIEEKAIVPWYHVLFEPQQNFCEAKACAESVCGKLELKLIWRIDLNAWDHSNVYAIQRVLLGWNDFIALVMCKLKERLY